MVAFEGIVRPFTTPNYGPVDTVQAEVPASDPISVKIGEGGKGYSFNGSESSTLTFYMDAKVKETTRDTTVHRVYNPDDHSQYVDVEAIDRLEAAGNDGNDYRKTVYEYNNEDTPDVTP